jgi:hypothetical protein
MRVCLEYWWFLRSIYQYCGQFTGMIHTKLITMVSKLRANGVIICSQHFPRIFAALLLKTFVDWEAFQVRRGDAQLLAVVLLLLLLPPHDFGNSWQWFFEKLHHILMILSSHRPALCI